MLDVLDTKLFKPMSLNRTAVAYYVGKGRKDDAFLPPNAIEITREYPTKREDLALLLAQLDHLVSFDAFSALSAEAALMGTAVLMPTASKEIQKLNAKHEFGITPEHGFAYTPAQLPQAKAGAGNFYEHYQSLIPMFEEDLDLFAIMLETEW